MGNPDGPTPRHIVDKLVEAVAAAATRTATRCRKGIPRLRRAICNWYQRRYDVELDPDTRSDRHDRLEGRHRAPDARDARSRRHRAGAEPELPDPHLRRGDRRRRHPLGADDAGRRFLRRARARDPRVSYPEAEDADPRLPGNPTAQCVELDVLRARRSRWRASTTSTSCTTSPTPTSCFDGWKAPSIMQVPGAREVAVEFFTMSKSYNMAGWRIGFMVGNQDLVTALARIKSYHDYGTFTPIQVASIAALEGPQECVEEIAREVPEAPRRAGARACTRRAGWSTCPRRRCTSGPRIPRAVPGAWARSSSRRSCWRTRRSRCRRASASATTATTMCASR